MRAVELSSGSFIMLFDDDDWLNETGLRSVLRDCTLGVPAKVCGFIYHLADENGRQLGSSFINSISNLIKIRSDELVDKDKKEVVLSTELKRVMRRVHGPYRRIPTSLYWSLLALEYDVICRNIVIGRKTYRVGGMTSNIARLKKESPYPIFRLQLCRLQAYVGGRYRSLGFAGRSIFACFAYGVLCLVPRLR